MTDQAKAWPCDSWRDPLLIVRLSSLGDVILSGAMVPLLRSRRPDLTIDFLTRAQYAPLVACMPGVRHVIRAEKLAPEGDPSDAAPNIPHDIEPNAAPNAAPNATPDDRSGFAADYPQVLDLQGGRKGRRALAPAAPRARRITYDRAAWKRRWIVLAGKRVGAAAPVVARFAEAVSGSRPPAGSLRSVIEPPADRLAFVAKRLTHRPLVVVSTSASRPLKAVPGELAERIRQGLIAEGMAVVDLLPPEEVSRGAHPPGRPEKWGEWFVREPYRGTFRGPLLNAAALLAHADAVVSSDSGILHLAGAVGTPAVGLYGPTSPVLGFPPLGRGRAYGIELACRPCHIHGPRVCWMGHRRCWRLMRPDDIVAVVAGLLPASGK